MVAFAPSSDALRSGADQEPAPPPRQGAIDYARDTAIDVGKSVTGVVGDVGALAGNKDLADLTDKASYWLERGKSERGQYVTKNPSQNQGGLIDQVVEAATGMAGYVPAAAAVGATGPAAPYVGTAVFGGLGVGALRHHVRTAVMSAPEETMWQSSKYQRARGEGLDDHAARERVYDQVLEDIPSQVIAGGAGAVGGGLLTKAFGKMGSEAFANAMTDRIIGRMGLQGAEATAGGLAQMGGQEYAGQRGERVAGIGPTENLPGAIETAVGPSLAFGALGLVHGALSKRPVRPGEKKPAPPIGTDVEAVAADQTADQVVAGNDNYGAPQQPAPAQMRAADAGQGSEFGPGQRAPRPMMRPEDIGGSPDEPPPPGGGPPAMHPMDVGEEPIDFRAKFRPGPQEAPPTPQPLTPPDFREKFRQPALEQAEQEHGERVGGEEYGGVQVAFQQEQPRVSIVDTIKQSIARAEEEHPVGGQRIDMLKVLQDGFKNDLTDLQAEIAERRKTSTVEMEPDEAAAHRQETARLVKELQKGIEAHDLIDAAVDKARDESRAVRGLPAKKGVERIKEVAAEKKATKKPKEAPEPVQVEEVRPQGTLGGKGEPPIVAAAPIRTNVAALGEVTRTARQNLKERSIRPSSPIYRDLFNAERDRLMAEKQAAYAETARIAEQRRGRKVPLEEQEKVAEERQRQYEAEQLARGENFPPTARELTKRSEETATREREAAGISEPAPEARDVEGILDKLTKGVARVARQPAGRNPLLHRSFTEALRKAKDRARKSVRQSPEYAERELIAERLAKSHQGTLAEYIRNLGDFLTRMFQQGARRYALSRESMINVAKEIVGDKDAPKVGSINWRLQEAERQYKEAEARYGGSKKSQITWSIGRNAREDTGVWNLYLHELKMLRKDLVAVTNDPQRQLSLSNHIVNYYMAERSALGNEPMKAINLLRQERRLLMDKYQARVNELMEDPSAHRDEIEKLQKLVQRFRAELQGSEEAPSSVQDLIAHMPEEDYKKALEVNYAHAIDQVVRDDNEAEQAAVAINTERQIPSKVKERQLTPYQQSMVKRFGDGWLMLSNREKTRVHMTGEMPTYNVPIPEQKRTEYMLSRAHRLNDALVGIPQHLIDNPTGMNLFDLHQAFRERLGEEPEKVPTHEIVQADIKRAEAELEDLSNKLRGQYEAYVPDVKGHEVGLGEMFNKNTDLTTPGVMPAGSFRVKVSSLIRRGDRAYGVRPDETPASAIRHHFYDVVHELLGDMDTVVLTPEQMVLAAREVGVPADSPAFYDPKSDRIFIDRDRYNSPDRAALLSHEFTHSITEEALSRFPELRKRMEKMFDQFRDRYVVDRDLRERLAGHEQAADNVHEFLAHLWQEDSKLPEVLHDIPTSEVQRDQYRTQRSSNVLVETLKAIKRGLTGMFWNVSKKRLLNDATINSLDMFRMLQETGRNAAGAGEARPALFGNTRTVGREMLEGVTEKAKDIAFRFQRAGGASNLNNRGVFMRYLPERVRRFDPKLAEIGDKAIDVKGFTEATQKEIAKTMDEPLIRRLAEYVGKGSYDQRENRLFEYARAENDAQVYGSSDLYKDENSWVSKTNPEHRQMINRHTELAKQWKALNPEEQTLLKDIRNALRKRHEDVRQAALSNFVEGSGVLKDNKPDAVAAAIKIAGSEKLTPAEETALNKDLNISRADFDEKAKSWRRDNTFKRLEGAFYPLIRRGDWMVSGRYDIPKAIGFDENKILPRDTEHPNRFTFAGNADRDAFIDKLDDGKHDYSFKVLNVGDKYVDVNPEHFSGHTSERKAYEHLEELKSDPNFIPDVASVRRDSDTNYDTPIHQMSAVNKLVESLKNSPGFRSLDKVSQNVMERELREMGVRHLLSSAARSKYLPRKYTRGADDDFPANVRQYLHNTSYTMAELKHRNELHAQVKAMDDYIRERRNAKDFDGSVNPLYGENEKFGLQRSQFQREMHRRLALRPQEHTSSWLDKSINMLLKLSYMGKLASPGFNILNSTEPWLLGAPIMAGEHGMKAYGELRRAYGMFGIGRPLTEGFSDMAKVWKEGIGGDPILSDQVKGITQRIRESGAPDADNLTKVIDFLHRTQYINRDAGMELGHILDPNVTRVGRVIDFADMLSRTISSAVEAQNRSTTAVAAYRLEFAKTHDHDASMRYAQRVLEKSAGNYAWYNKPEIFNQRYIRFAAQFKQYALRVTQNYARMIAGAYHYMAHNDAGNPEIQAQNKAAMHQLMMLVASQSAVSGLLGLPTEPFKAIINAAHVLGLSDYNSDDVEAAMRRGAARLGGPEIGEIAMRGLPRFLGTGLGERAAHSTLWTAGALGDKPDSWWQSIGHLAAGAPGDTLVQAVQGMGKTMQGLSEYRQGATSHGEELMLEGTKQALPYKVMSDMLGLVHDTVYGKHGPTGQPTGVPVDTGEFVSRLMGIRTGRQLEESEAKGEFIRTRDQYNQGRAALLQAYATASTPGEKASIRDGMRKQFNEGLPTEAQISIMDLHKYDQLYKKRQGVDPTQLGMTTNRHTRALMPAPGEVYRYQ